MATTPPFGTTRVANKKHNAGFYVNIIFESQPSVIEQLKNVSR